MMRVPYLVCQRPISRQSSRHPRLRTFYDNYRNDLQALSYAVTNYAPKLSLTEALQLAILYPGDPASGSPFGTGTANQLSPEFKRIAAISGDLVRVLISHACV